MSTQNQRAVHIAPDLVAATAYTYEHRKTAEVLRRDGSVRIRTLPAIHLDGEHHCIVCEHVERDGTCHSRRWSNGPSRLRSRWAMRVTGYDWPRRYRRSVIVPDGCPLGPHEFEVIALLADGLTAREIAERLDRKSSTVRSHTHTAYRRLGVNNRTQAVLLCARRGWITPMAEVQQAPHDEFAVVKGLLRKMIKALRAHDQRHLPREQLAYLEAVDDHIYLRNETSRERMDCALMGALAGTGVTPTAPKGDLVELLASYIEARTR